MAITGRIQTIPNIFPIFVGPNAVVPAVVKDIRASLRIQGGGSTGVAQDACGREISNHCFAAGDNPTMVLTLKDSDGDAIDTSGMTSKLTVATVTYPGGVRTVTELFSLTGSNQSPSSGGIVHFQPTTTQSNSGGIGCYTMDVQCTFPDGTRRTVVTGDWEYDGDVSDTGLD